MDVLHVAMECVPYGKAGGMADVVGALPEALREVGVGATVLVPYYPRLYAGEVGAERAAFEIWIGDTAHQVRLLEAGEHALLVDHPGAYDRPGLYDDPRTREGFSDSLFRCLVLSQAARRAVRAGHVRADVVHCHDNHTGMLPVYLKDDGGPPSVFTVHNLQYQGIYPSEEFWITGLSEDRFYGHSGFEFYGDLSLMKTGLTHADRITTVSPSYAGEILTPDFGYGLDGVLRGSLERLSGILNGIDTKAWNPATDQALAANYTARGRKGKAVCKRALQQQTGLAADADAPLIGMVTRVVEQKGVDLIGPLLPHLVRRGAQVMLLGSGDENTLAYFRGGHGRWPDRVAVFEGYDEALSHQVYAGSDIFCMPSRFEPCGLGQLYAMRYGAVPVVTAMGGLKDTVLPFDEERLDGTGVLADWATTESMQGALDYALDLYGNKQLWRKVQANGMKRDSSWERSAQEYRAIYEGCR